MLNPYDLDATRAAQLVRVELVREHAADPPTAKLVCALDVARYLAPYLQHSDRERLYSILIDGQNRVIGVHEVSCGSLSASIVHPREVFKAAILANAASIVLAHNHPSGSIEPSKEDIEVTERIRSAGEILGIRLLDHVIVTPQGGSYSIVHG